jgi:hypothetical protein
MKKLLLFAAVMLGVAALMAGSASGMVDPKSVALSDSTPSALSSDSQTFAGVDGMYTMSSSASLDSTATNATLGRDGYLCGDVGYNAIQKWYDPVGIVVWTYKSHLAVHVCHNQVKYKVALWDEPVDSNFGWAWCGNIVRQYNNYTYEVHSYTKGCFGVFYKFADTRYPWAKLTIGGNGGLWSRKTGVGS